MYSRSLHRFAVLTAAATLGLVGVGGLVTSHGAGMAVPDWPNTYGYTMFFFPISKWVGGIFYEHTHRLLASAVGLLTVVLALWLYGRSARPLMRWSGLVLLVVGLALAPGHPANGLVLAVVGLASFGASRFWPRCEPSPAWLRRCGLAAVVAVVLQGVLGGLRVVLSDNALGIVHATLAQLFFVLVCAIALFTSRGWQRAGVRPSPGAATAATDGASALPGLSGRAKPAAPGDGRTPSAWRAPGLASLFLVTTLLVLCQLTLGAAMRHQHAGLAIPDFPLAYGKLWPATDPASIAHYNAQRLETVALNPITAFQVNLQMVHRLMALLILAAAGFCAWSARRALGSGDRLSRMALVWLGLIVAQGLLGACTIWSNKAADITTCHVLVGAVCLALGALLTVSLIAASRESAAESPLHRWWRFATILPRTASGPSTIPDIF
jgi:heme a synthase